MWTNSYSNTFEKRLYGCVEVTDWLDVCLALWVAFRADCLAKYRLIVPYYAKQVINQNFLLADEPVCFSLKDIHTK